MRTVSTPVVALLAAAAIAALVGLIAGCESKPAAPDFDNPWDPQGPTSGDALQVRATANDTTISVTWNQPQGMGIISYLVGHALDSGGPWEDLDQVDDSGGELGFYSYRNPLPTSIHYFRVQAFTADDFSIVGYARAAAVESPPRMEPVSGRRNRASRFVDLAITVAGYDSLRLADNDTFGGDTTVAVVSPGEPQIVTWDLGPAEDAADFEVHVIAVNAGGFSSPRASLEFTAAFGPTFTVAGAPATVGRRAVDLVVPTEGVLEQRFALSESGLTAAPWQAPADTVIGFLLADSANPQTIWGEFNGDFGYATTHSVGVTPDLLDGAGFAIDAPDNRIVDSRFVTATNDAVATLMRFGENADFNGVAWQPYAATADLVLSEGAGRKVVYAQFRNDWGDSPILTDYVDLVAQPASVTILAPADGSVLGGGVPLLVRGAALAGSGTARLDSVRFDPGGGAGWQQVDGLESWTYLWNVPAAAADSNVVLRARAWVTDTATSAIDSATATVTVTIFGKAAP